MGTDYAAPFFVPTAENKTLTISAHRFYPIESRRRDYQTLHCHYLCLNSSRQYSQTCHNADLRAWCRPFFRRRSKEYPARQLPAGRAWLRNLFWSTPRIITRTRRFVAGSAASSLSLFHRRTSFSAMVPAFFTAATTCSKRLSGGVGILLPRMGHRRPTVADGRHQSETSQFTRSGSSH